MESFYTFMQRKPTMGILRNAWVEFPKFNINAYMRTGRRLLIPVGEPSQAYDYHQVLVDRIIVPTLEIATVYVIDEVKTGEGNFTRFLEWIEPKADGLSLAVMVENPHDRLSSFLQRRGYELLNRHNPDDLSMIRIPEEKDDTK